MLVRTKYFDWTANFAFTPPTEDILINTDEIVTAKATNCNRCGPIIKVRLNDGRTLDLACSIEALTPRV